MPHAELRLLVAAVRSATEGDYLRLLGPGGLVSPREVTYQPFADPGQLLAELVRAAVAEQGERPRGRVRATSGVALEGRNTAGRVVVTFSIAKESERSIGRIVAANGIA